MTQQNQPQLFLLLQVLGFIGILISSMGVIWWPSTMAYIIIRPIVFPMEVFKIISFPMFGFGIASLSLYWIYTVMNRKGMINKRIAIVLSLVGSSIAAGFVLLAYLEKIIAV